MPPTPPEKPRELPVFSQNLPAALQHAGFNQRELARRMGVAPSTTSHWMTGRRLPDSEVIAAVARALGVRAAWLAFGEGSMVETERVDTVPPPPARGPRRASGVTRAATTAPAVKVA